MFRNKEWGISGWRKRAFLLEKKSISFEEKMRFFSRKKRPKNGTFF
jgi:hypothetical protein